MDGFNYCSVVQASELFSAANCDRSFASIDGDVESGANHTVRFVEERCFPEKIGQDFPSGASIRGRT